MTGTFSSFNTALGALRYNRVAMDVASGNIANAATEGYVRRRVEPETVGAPAAPAMWSRYDGAGEGVRVAGLARLSDQFLDARARLEHGGQSYLSVRQTVLERVEGGVGEPGENGVAAALSLFRSGWHDLANTPGGEAARSQLLGRAEGLAESIRTQARNVAQEVSDQRVRLSATVGEVNTVAADLAATNESVAEARFNGTDANALLDQRDRLAMRLAELTGATASLRPDGGLDVTLGGVALVSGRNASTLALTSGATAGAVSFALVDPAGGTTGVPTPGAAAVGGEAGAMAELITVTLPEYAAGLDAVAQELVEQVNAGQAAGYDLAGDAGTPLYSYDPAVGALSLAVAIDDPSRLAASGIPGGVLDGSNAAAVGAALGASSSVEADYQRLVTGLGSEVASARRLAANQSALVAQVDGSREQLSGVSLDEEMIAMVTAQRAYEAAARVMTTIDSVLDTLINRTGLVGR